MKKFNIGTVKMEMHQNGFPKGLSLKRKLTIRESKHIIRNLLGIDLNDKDCFDSIEEYKEYNNDVCDTVNDWLIGNCDDDSIMEYAYDCSDEPIGIMNLIPIINYLKKLDIID